tara:strand:+ start:519 stop:707 length:189 start_codon:yes stop_codon:yes gene_type:complete
MSKYGSVKPEQADWRLLANQQELPADVVTPAQLKLIQSKMKSMSPSTVRKAVNPKDYREGSY